MAGVTTGLSRLFKAGGLEVRDTFCWKKAINHGLLEFRLKIVILYQTLFFLSSWEVVGIFLQCCCLPMGLTSMGSELRWKNSISRKGRVKLEMGSNWTWDISIVRWEEARSGQSFEVTNPATGEVESIAKFYKTKEKCIIQIVIFWIQVLCSVPDMSTEDTQVWQKNVQNSSFSPSALLQAAIEAAHTAFQTWQHTTAKERSAQPSLFSMYSDLVVSTLCPQTRSNLLRAWYNLCVTHQQELARILTAEQGKRSVKL